MKLETGNWKLETRRSNLRRAGDWISRYGKFLLLASCFLLLTAAPAAAQIIPLPGATCQDEECHKNICPCLTRDSATGQCLADKQLQCFAGKCGFNAEDAATQNLPCNFALDDLTLTAINIARFVMGITGSLMLLFIVYGGYQYVTALGNPEAIQAAQKTLTSAFVGLIIIFAATILVRFAAGLIGAVPAGKVGLERVGVCIKADTCPAGMKRPELPEGERPPCEAGQSYCVPL